MATSIDEFIIRKIKFRPDIDTDWLLLNPILPAGELGIGYPSKILKIGDGVTLWNDLDPFNGYPSDNLDNVLTLDANGYLHVPNIINDAVSDTDKTYSSKKIDQLTTNLFNVTSINSEISTLDTIKSGRNNYLRYTRALGTQLDINVSQSYLAGMVFNIRSITGITKLNPIGVTLNLPPNGSLLVPAGGSISIVFVSPTEADVFGYVEFA